MSVIRWFRKNNKKLLALFGTLLMIGFLLPTYMGRQARTHLEHVVGYVNQNGQKQPVTNVMLYQAKQQLNALRALEVDTIAMMGLIPQVREIGNINKLTIMAVHQLLFGEPNFSRYFRRILYELAHQADWTKNPQDRDQIITHIDQLALSDINNAELYYLLLTQEAHNGGIYATKAQIDALINVRQQAIDAGRIRPVSFSVVLSQFALTEDDLRNAMGNYIAVLRYGHLVTRTLDLSEPQLRTEIRDLIQYDTVEGTFVRFNGRQFLDKVSEPNEQDLQGHFDAYRRFSPDQTSDDNPFGFGYLLPDRVQVEFLRVDINQAANLVAAEFAQLTPQQQEDQLREYWLAHKDAFREEVPQTKDQDGKSPPPQYRHLPFDEAYEQVKTACLKQQARQMAEKVLAEAALASQSSHSTPSAKPDSPDTVAATENLSDFVQLARQFSTSQLPVSYGKTDFIFYRGAQSDPNFAYTYQLSKGQPQYSALDIIFDCQPLHKGLASKYELAPVRLGEDIKSLLAIRMGQDLAAYMMRVVAVDRQREPVSLNDDGRQGPASQIAAAGGENPLKEQVKEDWKNLQAYGLAEQKARQFAQSARSDWTAALTEFNAAVAPAEPNQPARAATLKEDSLTAIRQQIDHWQQMAQNNPNVSSYVLPQVTRLSSLLRKAVLQARSSENAEQGEIAVINLPIEFSCLVFKDLQVKTPGEDEYLRRKPLVTEDIISRNQNLMTIIHLNPENIEKRAGFERKVLPQEIEKNVPFQEIPELDD